MNTKLRPALALLAAALATASCSKKESDVSAGAPPATKHAAQTSAANSKTPATVPGVHHVAEWVDDDLAPSVWLTANESTAPEIPNGTALILTAGILGAKGPLVEYSADDVTVEVTNAAGAKIAWPLQRVSKSLKFKIDDTTGADVTWFIADTSGLAAGTYHASATLKGGARNQIEIKMVAATATMPDDKNQTRKFVLDVKAALLKADNETALKIVGARVAAHPKEILAYDLQGDVLAAQGKTKEAANAYERAFSLFTIQNPKSPEVPAHLLAKIKTLSTTAPASQP